MNDVDGIQRVTTATDVYAFAMTVVQVRISVSIGPAAILTPRYL